VGICSSKGSSQTRKITDTPGYKNASTAAVPSTVKSQMANDLVHMCATDIRPISIVDGGGFNKVAQKLISIGAQYGNVSVGDVLPCPWHGLTTFAVHGSVSQLASQSYVISWHKL